jgi:uncharacterized protein YyaL (SSP411 family)
MSISISSIPDFSRLILGDVFGVSKKEGVPLQDAREAAIAWLVRAHDKEDGQGVSYGYSLRGGWRKAYVETTGYIATTFYNLAKEKGSEDFSKRATAMVDWLCSVQREDGSFTNDRFAADSGIVFDTGQDLFGLNRGFKETASEAHASAANRAADWLVNIADDKGRWTRSTHNGIPHVYNSRVAWALLQANEIWPNDERLAVGRSNLDFAVEQFNNGWFDQCAFTTDAAPFTHTIAYAIRGLLEGGLLLKDDKYINVATEAARAVANEVQSDGYLAGQFDKDGKAAANYVCLTGNCQMAIIWAKLYETTGEVQFKEAGRRALDYVVSTMYIDRGSDNVRGAVKGSQPIWGKYSPVTFPNWATKFFVDAAGHFLNIK